MHPRYHVPMTSTTHRDLGHGVRVLPGDGNGLVVLSESLDLGWRARVGGASGSAVMWQGSGFEVVDREPWRRGARWRLEPWTGGDVMRVVLPLDEAAIGSAAKAARLAALSTRIRPWLWLLSPVLGFAPAAWQRRWRNTWGYPATIATWLSALLELAVGAAGVIETISAMGAGVSIFPWIPRPIVFISLVLSVESLIRLAQVAADSEPVGSVFGLVAAVFERRSPRVEEPLPAPSVEAFDATAGTLELLSLIQRRDWEGPGQLPYRGDVFALEATTRLGESWVYHFAKVDAADERPRPVHRLLLPRSKVEGRTFSDQPGVVKTVLLSIACTMAPCRFQERWAWQLGVRPAWFTVIGAAAELIGGLSNLGGGRGGGFLALLLNLFFVFEALVRFSSVVLKGRPQGSLFGLPLVPILERILPEPGPLSEDPGNE